MVWRKTYFCGYFTVTMADVCSSSCNSGHLDNHVSVLIPGCHLILSKIKAESMYHSVSFFTIYKNKNFIWVVWFLVCVHNCESFYLERMCVFIKSWILSLLFHASYKGISHCRKKLQNLCQQVMYFCRNMLTTGTFIHTWNTKQSFYCLNIYIYLHSIIHKKWVNM